MKTIDFCEVMGDIRDDYVNAAHSMRIAKKFPWLKWSAIAACFVLFIGSFLFQINLSRHRTDIVTLDNGDKITFEKTDTLGGSLNLDINVSTSPLTETESAALFADLPVTGNAIFYNNDMDTTGSPKLIGFEGRIENLKMIMTTSDIQLLDTEIEGIEEISTINDVDIIAGYFVTDPNSQGEQNAIYYASFELGSCKLYLENAGTKVDSTKTKTQLAEVIQKLIMNGEPDLTVLDKE